MEKLGPAALVVIAVIVSAVIYAPQSSRAAFPGINGDIAFYSDREGDDQIFVVDSPGGNAVQLTHEGSNSSPTWSPDGTRIAFVSDRDGTDQIYIMEADGSQETGLTSDPGGGRYPAWSADGSTIAFIRLSESDSHYSLWTVDSSSGGSPVELINLAGEDTMPVFSPDGSGIAFAHADPNGDFAIYVADADGTNPTGITNNGLSDTWPDWSPDGSTIAFLCKTLVTDSEICVVDADGGNEHAITNNSTGDGYPAWSPDGTRIAFEGDGPDGYGIYTMNPSGGDVQPFSVHGDDYGPDWQPLVNGSITPTPTHSPTPPASPTPSPTPTGTPGTSLIQGDVNCSGTVNIDDFVFLIEYAAGVNDGTTPGDCPDVGGALPAGVGVPSKWGDVNCDDAVDALDALYVLAWPDFELPHPGCEDIGQAL